MSDDGVKDVGGEDAERYARQAAGEGPDPLEGLAERTKQDPGAPLEPAAVAAAAALRARDRAAFVRLKKTLEKAGAEMGEWRDAIRAEEKRAAEQAAAAAEERESKAREQERARAREPGEDDDAPEGDDAEHTRTAGDYWMVPGRIAVNIVKEKKDGDEVKTEFLTNFSARLLAECVETDGVNERRVYEVEARVDGLEGKRRASVPADEYNKMEWVAALGGDAVVHAGPGTRDHARAGIKLLSIPIPTRRVYTFTGWHEIEGKRVYLHAGGAIGGQAEVKLPAGMDRFKFPAPLEGDALRAGVRKIFDLMMTEPRTVMVPLLSLPFRAALGKCRLIVYLSAEQNTGKTMLCTLVVQMFGPAFNEKSPPATMQSTAKGILNMLATIGDAVFLIDDFVIKGNATEDQRGAAKIEEIARAAFGGSEQTKLNRDSSLRRERPPRGVPLITGETLPPGHSLRSRMVTLDLAEPVKMDLEPFKRAAAAGELAGVMAAFVARAAEGGDAFRAEAFEDFAAIRDELGQITRDRRTSGEVADLVVGFRAFLEFARDVQAINDLEYDLARKRGWTAFKTCALDQLERQRQQDPVPRFLELLRAALGAGRCHVIMLDGARSEGPPEPPRAWGWRKSGEVMLGEAEPETGRYTARRVDQWKGQGDTVGYTDGKLVWLRGEVALDAARRAAEGTGEPLPLTSHMLHDRLYARKLLAKDEMKSRGTKTVRLTLGGTTTGGWVCITTKTLGMDEEAESAGAKVTGSAG